MTEETLKAYTEIKCERDQLKEMLEDLETGMEYISAQRLTGMPRSPSPGGNPLEDAAIRYGEIKDRYLAKLDELGQALLEIERAIDTLDHTERTMFRLHYMKGETWEQVAIAVNYSERQAYRIRDRALKKLESI